MDGLGYDISDFMPCEVCNQPAVDIHHIDARGMGGSMLKDILENLMALCRACHDAYGDIKEFIDYLTKIHLLFIAIKNQ